MTSSDESTDDLGVSTSRAGLAAVVVLGTALRGFRLTTWGFAGDEIFTLRDSLEGTWESMKPLLFVMNHYLIAPWAGFDEASLRILPFAFGVLGILAVYWLGRRLVSRRVGLVAAVLVALCPWHVYWSQNARYYSLVFLLSAVAAGAIYVAVVDEELKWAVAGVLAAGFGVLAHPSAGLVLAGTGAWLVWHFAHRALLSETIKTQRILVGAGVVVALAAVAGVVLVPRLIGWLEMGQTWGHGGLGVLLSFGAWLTPALGISSLAGILWLLHEERSQVAMFLFFVVAVPATMLVVLSGLVAVSTAYLFATVPFVIVAASAFVDRLAVRLEDGFTARLSAVTATSIIVLAGAPTLISHYKDGGRPDFRSAAEHIRQQANPGDVVVADQANVLRYYLPDRSVYELGRDTTELAELQEKVSGNSDGGALWIVAEYRDRGGFNEKTLGSAEDWVRDECEPAGTFHRPRLDFRQNEVRIHRCPLGSQPGV